MTHEPILEEILTHLVVVHGCSAAIGLREEISREVAQLQAPVIMVNGGGGRDITEEVGAALLMRMDDFDRLHDAHHAEQIASELLEFLKHDEPMPHEHEQVRREG